MFAFIIISTFKYNLLKILTTIYRMLVGISHLWGSLLGVHTLNSSILLWTLMSRPYRDVWVSGTWLLKPSKTILSEEPILSQPLLFYRKINILASNYLKRKTLHVCQYCPVLFLWGACRPKCSFCYSSLLESAKFLLLLMRP